MRFTCVFDKAAKQNRTAVGDDEKAAERRQRDAGWSLVRFPAATAMDASWAIVVIMFATSIKLLLIVA